MAARYSGETTLVAAEFGGHLEHETNHGSFVSRVHFCVTTWGKGYSVVRITLRMETVRAVIVHGQRERHVSFNAVEARWSMRHRCLLAVDVRSNRQLPFTNSLPHLSCLYSKESV